MRLLASLCCLSFAIPMSAQTTAPDTATSHVARRHNAWASGGVGIGSLGIGMVGSLWYSNNHIVIGARKALVNDFPIGRDVHDTAYLLGLRNIVRGSLMLIAVGPAQVGGLHHRYESDPSRFVPAREAGVAAAAEWVRTYGTRGLGVDFFAARSANRSMAAATFSIEVGWFGY